MGSQLKIDYVSKHIQKSIDIKNEIISDIKLLEKIYDVSNICLDAFKAGNKVILAGNGGSAADSQHIAAEFVSRFRFDRPALPSISLSTDTSMLTAIGNDYGYKYLFSRQLQANSKPGDIFIGITTSGNSENIIEAVTNCEELGVTSVSLVGNGGGKMTHLADHSICVPSLSTEFIQESHIMIGHIICGFVEDSLFTK
jgi:D-sedoheptulose 7-phosphate isomerase